VQSLRRWGVVDQAQLHCVRFIRLEASEFDHAGRGTEHAVGAHCIVSKLLCDAQSLVRLGLGNDAALDLNLIRTVRRRLISETLFKMVSASLVV